MQKKYRAGAIAIKQAEVIEHENQYNLKPPMRMQSKQHGIYSPGICRICGASFTAITKSHAARHGFINREAMVEAGVVAFTGFFDGN